MIAHRHESYSRLDISDRRYCAAFGARFNVVQKRALDGAKRLRLSYWPQMGMGCDHLFSGAHWMADVHENSPGRPYFLKKVSAATCAPSFPEIDSRTREISTSSSAIYSPKASIDISSKFFGATFFFRL